MNSDASDKTKQEIGNRLRQAREKLGLSQAEIAAKSDISANYYARIERGEENFSIDVLANLIKALKVKSSEILPF